ncbi:MAG: hypothetical protein KF684_07495 [Phycisphaeraceae bacterium]|nr:hypothetical protein [Phycisphaeraceae bacterium]
MKLTALIALAAGLTASAANAQQFWNLGESRLSTSISNNGVVVGDNLVRGEYFLWTAGAGFANIGGQIAGDGVGGQSTISHDGSVVAGTVFNSVSGTQEMGRYNVGAGTWTPLGGIGAVSDAETSSGWGISGDGSTIVGLGWVTPGSAHAVRWRAGTGMVDLGTTTSDRSTRANNTNFDGSVVVGWQDNDNGRQGAVWVNGTQSLIFDNDGFASSEAVTVSASGEWASGFQFGGFFEPSELWRYNTSTNTYEGLGNLTDGGAAGTTAGSAMNADGSLIAGGTWGFGPAFFGTAIIWEDGVGVQRFSDYISSRGVSYEDGYSFSFVTDMSSDGLWFTGWGLTANFELTSFVVYVPTPASGSVLALGMIAMRRRRR